MDISLLTSLLSSGGSGGTSVLPSALISSVPSLVSYFTGRSQNKEANRLAKTPRPFYNIPKSIYENVSMTKNLAGSEMAGSNYLRGRTDRVLSNAANQARMSGTNPASILGVISGAAGQAMDKEAELAYKNAAWKSDMTGKLMGANQTLAGFEDKAFDWNKKQPYLDAMAAASALKNSALHNKYNAVNELAKVWGSFAGGKVGGGKSGSEKQLGGQLKTSEQSGTLSQPSDMYNEFVKKYPTLTEEQKATIQSIFG